MSLENVISVTPQKKYDNIIQNSNSKKIIWCDLMSWF